MTVQRGASHRATTGTTASEASCGPSSLAPASDGAGALRGVTAGAVPAVEGIVDEVQQCLASGALALAAAQRRAQWQQQHVRPLPPPRRKFAAYAI